MKHLLSIFLVLVCQLSAYSIDQDKTLVNGGYTLTFEEARIYTTILNSANRQIEKQEGHPNGIVYAFDCKEEKEKAKK